MSHQKGGSEDNWGERHTGAGKKKEWDVAEANGRKHLAKNPIKKPHQETSETKFLYFFQQRGHKTSVRAVFGWLQRIGLGSRNVKTWESWLKERKRETTSQSFSMGYSRCSVGEIILAVQRVFSVLHDIPTADVHKLSRHCDNQTPTSSKWFQKG